MQNNHFWSNSFIFIRSYSSLIDFSLLFIGIYWNLLDFIGFYWFTYHIRLALWPYLRRTTNIFQEGLVWLIFTIIGINLLLFNEIQRFWKIFISSRGHWNQWKSMKNKRWQYFDPFSCTPEHLTLYILQVPEKINSVAW